MVQEQPPSPSGILHQVALSPPAAAASGLKVKGPHISIEIPGDSAAKSSWRPALVVGLLLFATAIPQVVLAYGIREKVSVRRQPSFRAPVIDTRSCRQDVQVNYLLAFHTCYAGTFRG